MRGEAALAAKDYLTAADALSRAERAVKAAPEAVPQPVADRIHQRYLEVYTYVGRLQIEAEAGTTIRVGDITFGTAPIGGEILVLPGSHRVVSRGLHCLGSKDVDVRSGRVIEISVPCKTAPAWRVPLITIGYVAAVVGVGAGIMSVAISEQKSGELDRTVRLTLANGFRDSQTTSDLRRLEHERVSWLNASITSFVIAGAALAGATALTFGVKPRRPEEPPKTLGAAVTLGGAGFWMRW